jgi:hypothetical protein
VNQLATANAAGAGFGQVVRLRDVLVSTYREVTRGLFDGYRPERYYMRGPGPKWRAKHGLRTAG